MRDKLGRPTLASLFLIMAGCCNSQPRPLYQSQPVAPPSPQPVIPAAPAAVSGPGVFQAPPGAIQPGPISPPPTAPAAPFPTVPPPAPPGPGAALTPSDAIARVEHRWQPADPVQLGAPEPITSAGGKETPRLYPPGKTGEPPLIQAATNLPVGIPQFATAVDHVATGLRPSLDDGLDWLQARGFKTVLQIRLPGDDDATDRKQVEKRGMKYLSIEVSPPTLTKATMEEFTRIIRATSSQPLFVYDRDGSLAGGLWYLYFRTTLQLSDDVARVRAGSLGLREDSDGAQRDMWLAIQKYLSDSTQ
jgi:protein tyrosine phosphatase (PTP) superfamily phosphohydrolase (DUF442 family)